MQCTGMVCNEHAARCTLYRNGVQCTGNMYNVQARCSSKLYSVQTRCAVYRQAVYRQGLQYTGRIYSVQAGFTMYRQDLQCTGRIYSVQAGYKGTLATVVPPVCPMQSGVYGQEMAAYLCLLQRYD